MPVRVTLLGPLRDLAQIQAVDSQAATVKSLLDELARRFGDEFARRARQARILVNGSPVQFGKGEATPLAEGDEVALVFPVGGG